MQKRGPENASKNKCWDAIERRDPNARSRWEGFKRRVQGHERWIQTCGEEGRKADFEGETINFSAIYNFEFDLSHALLCNTRILKVKFEGIKFISADFTGAEIRSVFRNCRLSHAKFNGADMFQCKMIGCDAVSSHFINAELANVDLNRSNLTRSDLSNAKITGANLSNADLTGADLRNADLTGANLRNANLTGSRLSGTTFTQAQLQGAKFDVLALAESASLFEAKMDWPSWNTLLKALKERKPNTTRPLL